MWLPILPTIIFLFTIYKWYAHKRATSKLHLPPSPPKLPILGNIHQLGLSPHRSFRSLSQKYGDLMMVHLGSKPTLVVSSAKSAQEILKTHDAVFSYRTSTKTTNKLLYNGKDVAASQYGEYWRQMKSICVLQLLSVKRVRSFHKVREEELALMVGRIQKSAGTAVNLSEMFITLTNNVVCRVALGRTYSEAGSCNIEKLLQGFDEVLFAFRVGDYIPLLAWTSWIDGWDAKIDKVAQDFDNLLEQVVKEHEDRRAGNQNVQDDAVTHERVQDFVDVLLDVQQEKKTGFAIDRDSIKGLILDVFTGGTDTTSSVLEWTMTELLRHPKVMQELQKEVRNIAGNKTDVNGEDLERMTYLKLVIKETLRLHPPIPLLIHRLSSKDTKVNGFDIPDGITVLINTWAIHRDPASWSEPEKFNPDRFMNSSIDFKGQNLELIPFGAGRRICPGIMFAMVNIELVLANLMHKFDWSLPDGTDSHTLDTSESNGISIHRKTPLLAVARSVM